MKNRFLTGKHLKFFLYIIVVVLINMAGISLFYRLDLTANKSFSLSKVSKEVVASLTEPLTINVFFSKDLPAPHNNTEIYLHDLLEEYSLNGNKYFNYRFYDLSSEENDASSEQKGQKLAESYGIYPVQIQVVEQDEVKFKMAYMGMVLIHGDIIEKIPTISTTEGLEYSITTAIQQLNNKVSALVALKEKIKVTLFYSSSLSRVAPIMGIDNLPDLPGRVETTVKALNRKLFGKIDYKVYDPSREKKPAIDDENKNIMTLKWPDMEDGKIKKGEGSLGLVLEYGENSSQIQLLDVIKIPIIGTQYRLIDFNTIGEVLGEGIDSLIDVNETIGYLAGHGSKDINGSAPMGQQREPGLSNFNTLLSENYTVKTIDLNEGGVPESLKTLIIAGPNEKFSEYDLYQIDQALMKGTSLILYLDGLNEVMPSTQAMGFNQGPSYIPMDTGLERLLAHYGAAINPSYILDKSCYRQRMPAQLGGGEKDLYFAPVIKAGSINHELDILKNIKGLITMRISPLSVDDEKLAEKGITATMLFSSSPKSWELDKNINLNPMLISPPLEEEMHEFPLAYILEGSFSSYFTGKPVPVKKGIEKKNNNMQDDEKTKRADLSGITNADFRLDQGKNARILIVSTSQVLHDNMLDVQGKSPNAAFIMNTTDYLNDRGNIAVMRSKTLDFNPVDDISATSKSFIKFFNIAGLPVLVIIAGFIMWIRRKLRRKNIQNRFSHTVNGGAQ